MSVIHIAIFLLFGNAEAANWKQIYKSGNGTAITTAISTCPTNYIGVPANPDYMVRFFCVAKYEMKNDGYGMPTSVATGTPWVSISRDSARESCMNLGANYNLISNSQWQTIARDITLTASNWSTGTAYSGELNRGHSDNSPANAIAAVTDDNDPCNGTGQACTSTTWNSQRRAHKLSNGNVIWDFAGNVTEWVTNDNSYAFTPDTYASQMVSGSTMQKLYGPLTVTICATPGSTPYCGMGKGQFTGGDIGITSRGGAFNMTDAAGVFSSDLRDQQGNIWIDTGFRCVYLP